MTKGQRVPFGYRPLLGNPGLVQGPTATHVMPAGTTSAQADACYAFLVQRAAAVPVTPRITVKQLTKLQADTGLAARWPRMHAFLAEAGAPPRVTVPVLLSHMAQVWRSPWHNYHKEALWRLALDGFAMRDGARYNPTGARPCPCGSGQVSRSHHFWDCPAAAAVVGAVRAALPPAAASRFQRHHLWLAHPPASVHGGVWMVVCLAALSAMARAWRVVQGPYARADDPQRAALDAPAARQQRVERARLAAPVWFWAALEDFVWLHPDPPRSWSEYGRVPAEHPFIHRNARRRLCVSLPHRSDGAAAAP